MTKKDKEEERIERIIRGLLKLPENRRCINCHSLGPQYVCTTFNIFVCTNCSGVQEFTHRVKSVSMAKFNSEEVSGLQAGGNERARQIYFRGWDPQRHSYPDGSNLHRLRDFIKHVYVDRKFTGERNHQNLARLRMGDREESYESRKASAYRGSSTSPTYRNINEQSERFGSARRADDRSVKYYYDERRSPRYSQENSRYGGFKKNPARFEIVDDRVRGHRRGRPSDNRRFSHRDSRCGSMSPDYRNSMDRSNSPVVRSVKDILGENVPRLQVGEHSKATEAREANDSSENQMITSPGGTVPTDENSEKQIIQSSDSLIYLDTDSKNSDAAVAPQTQENHPSSAGVNGSSHESSIKDSTPKLNSLEFLLSELSVPPVAPAVNADDVPNNQNFSSTLSAGNVLAVVPPGQMLALLDNDGASATGSAGNMLPGGVLSAMTEGRMLALPDSSGASATVSEGQMLPSSAGAAIDSSRSSMPGSGISPEVTAMQTLSLLDTGFDIMATTATNNSSDSAVNVPQEHQISNFQAHQLALPAPDGSSAEQQIPTTVAAVNNQQLNPQNIHTAQGLCSASAEIHSQDASTPIQELGLDIKSQSLPGGTTFGARKELPADLFTLSYSPAPVPIPGWQMGQNYGMGYGMQYYPNAMHLLGSPNQAVSTNPFDYSNTAAPVQAPQFPSVGNLRGAIPSPSYASGMPLLPPPFASAVSSGTYMGQQAHMNAPPSGPGEAGGSNNDPFASLNIIQQPSSGYSLANSSSLPSHGGNPFG